MGRHVKDARIDTREARGRLRPSNEPYWCLIVSGFHLGYRKGVHRGTWVLRQMNVEAKKYVKKKLGMADDNSDSNGDGILSFREAQLKARELIDKMTNDHHKATVKDATTHYMTWFKDNRKSINETQTTIDAHILPYFGHKLITELTTKELKAWHQKLAANAARKRTSKFTEQKYSNLAETNNEKRSRKSTANRILTVLKAILNKAFQDEMIDDDLPWRRVKPFENVDEPKIRFLTVEEANDLIDACDPYLRKIVQAALYTGARYNELTSLKVADVQIEGQPSIYIQPSKSGKGRHVPLNGAGFTFFKNELSGKIASDYIFTKQDNSHWGKNHHVRLLIEACNIAKLNPSVSFHELRHTYASWLAQAGVDLLKISKLLGHADTRVTSRHYAHLCDRTLSDAVNQLLPDFEK